MTTNKTQVAKLQIRYDEVTTIESIIYKDEFGQYSLKIKYPKTGRSHFYSLANYVSELFDEQHPQWAQILHLQSRGEL
jgi:hypothetical protein